MERSCSSFCIEGSDVSEAEAEAVGSASDVVDGSLIAVDEDDGTGVADVVGDVFEVKIDDNGSFVILKYDDDMLGTDVLPCLEASPSTSHRKNLSELLSTRSKV